MRNRLIPLFIAMTLIAASCGGSDQLEIDGLAAEINPAECVEGQGEEVTIYSG